MFKLFRFAIVLLFISCSQPVQKPKVNPFKGMTSKERKSSLESALTRASKKEQSQINGYLKRHQIPAIQTKTGIHYCIYQKGDGVRIQDGENVTVEYVVTKINGDTLYSTQKQLDEFIVSNSEKESGLHEAIKLLKPGSKAIIILPSHRAHGISGDSDKIPPLTTVIYNLQVRSNLN